MFQFLLLAHFKPINNSYAQFFRTYTWTTRIERETFAHRFSVHFRALALTHTHSRPSAQSNARTSTAVHHIPSWNVLNGSVENNKLIQYARHVSRNKNAIQLNWISIWNFLQRYWILMTNCSNSKWTLRGTKRFDKCVCSLILVSTSPTHIIL